MIKKLAKPIRFIMETLGVDFSEETQMKKSHKELAEELYNIASMTLAESGEFYPTFFLVKDDKFSPIILDPEMKGVNPQTYISIVNNQAHEIDADAAIFISRQWTPIGKVSDEDLEDFKSGRKTPTKENRKDFLNLVYMTPKGKANGLCGEIKVSPNGVMYVEEHEWAKEAFANILTPWR